MSRLLVTLGLRGWKVRWIPDITKQCRGKVSPDARIIMIHDEDPDAAFEPLVHEALEIKIRGVLSPYREGMNALIQAYDQVVYQQEEALLDAWRPVELRRLPYTGYPHEEVQRGR